MAEEENEKPQAAEIPQQVTYEPVTVDTPRSQQPTSNFNDPNSSIVLSSWHKSEDQPDNVGTSSVTSKPDNKKPFLGGYLHRGSGTEYHHAFTQTPALPTYIDPSVETLSSTSNQPESTNQSDYWHAVYEDRSLCIMCK